jgi:hypothetical protein
MSETPEVVEISDDESDDDDLAHAPYATTVNILSTANGSGSHAGEVLTAASWIEGSIMQSILFGIVTCSEPPSSSPSRPATSGFLRAAPIRHRAGAWWCPRAKLPFVSRWVVVSMSLLVLSCVRVWAVWPGVAA